MDSEGKRNTEEVLRAVDETLSTVELGLEDLLQGPRKRRLPGLRNLVVFGRAVTSALQLLRGLEADFDAWYQTYVEEMRTDPLMKYFYKLRSRILKKADLGVYQGFEIKGSKDRPINLRELLGPPPPGVVRGFISSRGSGWEVRLPNGTEEKFYVDLPLEGVEVSHFFTDQPPSHLGKTLSADTTAEQFSELYVAYLRRMVEDAKNQFG
jgi:hypothetical protein